MSKHRVFVQRLIKTETDNIKSFLKQLESKAKYIVENELSGKTGQLALRGVMKDLHKVAANNMLDVAAYEAKQAVKVYSKYIEGSFTIPSTDALYKALTTDNIALNNVKLKGTSVLAVDNGATRKSLATVYKQFGIKKADELSQIIKDGITNKLENAAILAKISERVAGLQSTQARSLASVAINYSTNVAKSQVIEENRDIIAYEIWVRDIEADSCDECASLEGQVEEAGNFESPPIHWGCKCEVIPYVE